MKTNNILSILFAVVLGWVGSLSMAHASVGANPNDYTKKIMLDRFDKVKEDIYFAAKTTGMDMGDLTAIASIESDLQVSANNRHSSASGMLQHTKGTWNSDRKAYHQKLGLASNVKRNDPRASLLIGGAGLQNAKAYIVEKTHLTESQVLLGDQYMTHFLGQDMAVRVINSKSSTPMNRLVVISKGNWSMFVKPNGQVRTAREFRLYLDQLLKREKAFYAKEVTMYAAAKQREEAVQQFNDIYSEHMASAIANTQKYIGWSS